ncbi:Hypothetical predicted protein [Cloeon dipterum]|uniref:BHLH domain-containing protein n=1 Tax=Cloeon dipterum TaxID=197152 RepID=A0A8S1D206_9INSE|nr:Hypothetical predicted protein [Cloeon dipterum]
MRKRVVSTNKGVRDFPALHRTPHFVPEMDSSASNLESSLSSLDFFWSDFEPCPAENKIVSPAKDPFRPENKIPLPDCELLGPIDSYGLAELYSGVRKRNERERQRVRSVNEGFEKLRSMLPSEQFLEVTSQKRLSKVDVLRAAIQYINHLQGLLD